MKTRLTEDQLVKLIIRNDKLVRDNKISVKTYARRNFLLWSMVLRHKRVGYILDDIKQIRGAA